MAASVGSKRSTLNAQRSTLNKPGCGTSEGKVGGGAVPN